MVAGLLSIGGAASGVSQVPQIRRNSAAAYSNVVGDRSVSALRLRGGSDVKEAATGILFPKELVSGNNTLTVKTSPQICLESKGTLIPVSHIHYSCNGM